MSVTASLPSQEQIGGKGRPIKKNGVNVTQTRYALDAYLDRGRGVSCRPDIDFRVSRVEFYTQSGRRNRPMALFLAGPVPAGERL